MNIIITNFAQTPQNPVERTTQKVSSTLNEGNKSLDKAESITMKGQEKVENSLKTEKSLPPPQKNNTQSISKHNPYSGTATGVGSPQTNNIKQPSLPPIIVDNNKNKNSIMSKTGWQVRLDNPNAVKNIDLDTSISGAGDSVFVGNLKSTAKKNVDIQNNNIMDVAYLKPRQKYNTYMNVTSSNAVTPSQLAGLSGVWKVG